MAFIDTITEEDADEQTAAMYRSDRERMGYVPNYARIFGARPDVYAAWRSLADAIGPCMDTRRYELVTLAAAVSCGLRTAHWPMAASCASGSSTRTSWWMSPRIQNTTHSTPETGRSSRTPRRWPPMPVM